MHVVVICVCVWGGGGGGGGGGAFCQPKKAVHDKAIVGALSYFNTILTISNHTTAHFLYLLK